jgi:putative membrane protein
MLRRALLSSVAAIAFATAPLAFAQSPDNPPQPPPADTNLGAHSSFFDDHMHGEPFGGELVNMGAPARATTDPQPYTTGDTAMDDTRGMPTATSMTPVDSQGYFIETMPGYAQPAPVADTTPETGDAAVGASTAMADVGPTTAATVVVVPTQRALSPAEYVREASAGDLYEVQAGQLALQRSQSPEVRAMAQAMIDQHTQSSTLIAQAASQQGLTPVSDLPAPKLAMLQRLRDAPDDQFDRVYMDQQVTAHMNAAALHEGFAQSGSGALQQAAIQIQPTVQTHLDSAYAMSDVPVSLAAGKSAEDTQLASAESRSTFRGYHVVGPTRGDASGSVSAGGMDTTATSSRGGASDLAYGGSAARTTGGAGSASGAVSTDLSRTSASTTVAPDVPDANGQVGRGAGSTANAGSTSNSSISSANPTAATTPTAPTPSAPVPVTPK